MKKYLVIALIVIGSVLSIGATTKQCNMMVHPSGKYLVIKWAEKYPNNGRQYTKTWSQNVYLTNPHVLDLVLQCYHQWTR